MKEMIKIADTKVYINGRNIYLSDNVDNESMGLICSTILNLIKYDNECDNKQKDFKKEIINLYINSNGGSIYDMWGLIDIIRSSSTTIHTYCTGKAFSAGSALLVAGHKRFAYKHSTVMIHALAGCTCGKYQDMIESIEQKTVLHNMIIDYYLANTKIPKEKLDEITEKKIDYFISAEEALNLGIIDEIIG